MRFGNKENGNFVLKDSLKYKYDCMGNIIGVCENGIPVSSYEYDSLGRLVRENNKKFGKTYFFTYDRNGNILAKYEYAYTKVDTDELNTLEPQLYIPYCYDDDSDRLLSYGNELFEYDDIGNPTNYRGKTANWANGRQLTSLIHNNTTTTFEYDARGRRKAKNNITFTYDSNDNLIKQSNGLDFLYDHSGVFAFTHGGSTYFYRKNAQGDIIAILDSNGEIVVKYVYDAWGNCEVDESSTNATLANLNPFRYRSYYYDTETNLYFLKSRYYDPEIGRFITIDDISYLNPDNVNGLNLYAYCLNNPVMFSDPNGHAVVSFIVGLLVSTLIGGLISGGIAAGTAALTGDNIGAAFWGGFVTGSLSSLAVGVGMSLNGGLGFLACGGLGFVAGGIGNILTQTISSYNATGSIHIDAEDAIFAGFINSLISLATMGCMILWMSDSFSSALSGKTFVSRFVEFMSFDIANTLASTYFGITFGGFDLAASLTKYLIEKAFNKPITTN